MLFGVPMEFMGDPCKSVDSMDIREFQKIQDFYLLAVIRGTSRSACADK